jgi:hypothetical protein
LIGTMGNTGVPRKSDGKPDDQHVHYQLWDPAGNRINPTAFWDQRGPADPNPDPPAYLDAYQQYVHGLGGNAGNGSGNAPGVVSAPEIRPLSAPANEIAPVYARETRSLGRGVPGQPFFKTGVPAVPVVPPNPVLSRDRSESFSDRFGTWTSSADRIASDNSSQAAAQPGVAPAVTSNAPERYLSRRIVGGPQLSVFDAGAPALSSFPPMMLSRPTAPLLSAIASAIGRRRPRAAPRHAIRTFRRRHQKPAGHSASSAASRCRNGLRRHRSLVSAIVPMRGSMKARHG